MLTEHAAAPGDATLTGAKASRVSCEARRPVGLVAPLPPQVGGVASFAEWLLEHEAAIGCRYVVFDLERPPGDEAGGRLRVSALVRQAGLAARFAAWIRRAPRVVHVCVSYTTTGLARDLLFVALLRASGRRPIAHVHGGSLTPGDRSARALLVRLVSGLASDTVTIGPSAAAALASLGVRAGWVMNPVRLAPANGTRPALEGGPLRVLFAGTYGERKGTHDLLQAVRRARDAGADVVLRLAGKEEYRGEEAWLRGLADELGIAGAVGFDGVASPERLTQLYEEADVFCLPSHRDGLPMALLEAMAFGAPVLATGVGGIADVVVDGETGILVEPGNATAIAAALEALAGSAELRARLGEAGRRRAGELAAPEALATRWREIYERQGLDALRNR